MATITITLPDASTREYQSGVTGQRIAEDIGRRLAQDALAVAVNGETRDLARAITKNASVRILTWKDDEGKRAYWHSSAHLMAESTTWLRQARQVGLLSMSGSPQSNLTPLAKG